MNYYKTVAVVCLLAALVVAEQTRYDGYQVFRVTLNSERELNLMHEMEKRLGDRVEFWQSTRALSRPVDVMVKPQEQHYVKTLLEAAGLEFDVMMDDVQKVIDDQRMDDRVTSSDLATFDYSVYHTYEEIQQWIKDMVAAYPGITEEFTIGNSYEGRPIGGIKLKGSGSIGKPVVWFEGGIHAREWISPATVMYFTNKLLENYNAGSAEEVRLLDGLDWLIVPSLNVDGYAYTWSGDRLWRKTRSPNPGTLCIGTDPNRNWAYKWGGDGASTWPCSITYRGSEPHSEIEIRSVTDYLLNVNKTQDVRVFVDWHSYSQLWLAPWSYSATVENPRNSDQQLALGDEAVAEIKKIHGKEYISGPSAKTLYSAAGASVDWGYGTLGAKYSYVVELRDTGDYGFLLPADQIIPTGEEIYPSVLVLGRYGLDKCNIQALQFIRVFDVTGVTMNYYKTVAVLCFLAALVVAEQTRYDGYQVLRVTLNSESELNLMHDMENRLGDRVEFWQSTRALSRPVDVMVKPQEQHYVKTLLEAAGLKFNVMMDDVQKVIDDQRMDDRVTSSDLASFDYSTYHTYEEIQQWIKDMVAAYPMITEEFTIGNSYEGRPIGGIKLKGSGGSGKPVVWIEGGIHAREWISPATVVYFTNRLLENYAAGSTEEVRLLDGLDWLIVPSLNVDGYAYTWDDKNGDRLWRKTRSPNLGTSCIGTDANRNWAYKWGGDGASTWPCSRTYRGSEPHSEIEIISVTEYLLNVKKTQDIRVFVDWHSYTQLWLAPWSYSTVDNPRNADQQLALGDEAVAEIKKVHGKEYISGQSAKTLYVATGASVDWGYGTLGAKYSYLVELRDTGEYGFLLPADQIIPTGEEIYSSVLVLGRYGLDNY
ncbi:uncharacterized protein [Antedon mediterranea]|uniref:uncharacterized protein n=1 Tax=Antedon mediterranea TaxID=105859 RepID=UPI003AF73ACC